MRVSERLSELLGSYGIREAFGNPGTTELPFLEDLHQKYYLTLHDAIAVGAADGLSLVTRSVTLANLHAAPGLGNSIGFLDTARRNRSPVIVTVGQQDLRHLAQRPLLAGDLESMVQGLVKYAHEVRTPAELEETIREAIHHALDWPMGPVLVSLPMNVMEEVAGPPAAAGDPAAEPSYDVTPIAQRLRTANNPVIVVGYEVDIFDGFLEVATLAERLGCPVYAEPICSRSPIPSGLPNFAGDLLPQSALISSILGLHDLVVLVGADLTLYPYSAAPLPSGRRMVYVGSDPTVASKFGCEAVIGNLRGILRDLLKVVPATGRSFRRPTDFARANRVARAAQRLGAEFIADALARVFPDYTIVDESVSMIPTMKSVGFYHGKDSYFSSRSQQLGWGLAASIGISLRQPKTLVVLGDGALQYSVQALWTLGRYELPTKVVVVNNGGYTILKSYSRANHPRLEKAEYLDLPGVDVEDLARAYGVPASTVTASDRLEVALRGLRDEEGPSLLNVEMDRSTPDLFS